MKWKCSQISIYKENYYQKSLNYRAIIYIFKDILFFHLYVCNVIKIWKIAFFTLLDYIWDFLKLKWLCLCVVFLWNPLKIEGNSLHCYSSHLQGQNFGEPNRPIKKFANSRVKVTKLPISIDKWSYSNNRNSHKKSLSNLKYLTQSSLNNTPRVEFPFKVPSKRWPSKEQMKAHCAFIEAVKAEK